MDYQKFVIVNAEGNTVTSTCQICLVMINLKQGKPPLLLNMAMYTNEQDTANICTVSAHMACVTC